MRLGDKSLVLYPEYHLTDFPPRIAYRQSEVEAILRIINAKADIIVSGYVEGDGNEQYSSCLIIDGDRVFNIRKKHPYSDEIDIISNGNPEFILLPLSVGESCFFVCNDITYELNDGLFHKFAYSHNITNFFLISAMGKNFNKWFNRLKETSKQLGVKNVIYCDRFNGEGIYTNNLSN